jgi:hypothetical protein
LAQLLVFFKTRFGPASQIEEKATGAVDKGQTGPIPEITSYAQKRKFLWITTCIFLRNHLGSPSIHRQTSLVVRKNGESARSKSLNLGFRPQAVDIFGDNAE